MENKGKLTEKNRTKYVITSEKAKDLAKENKIAWEIIDKAKEEEEQEHDKIRELHDLIIEALKKLIDTVTLYSNIVPNKVLEEQVRFKTMARKVDGLIKSNMIMTLNDHEECRACGQSLTSRSSRWQFCPVCGQRFRDRWEEMNTKVGR